MAKHIIVAGGVLSGIGKGIAAASIALLMKQRGHTVQCIKFDPYLNVDAGIMSPHEHGEVWVTDNGAETDMDLGHYERIADVAVTDRNILTSGTLYKELIHEQEHGKWLGQTIQIIPHVADKIMERLDELGENCDIVISEIGGTVGDLESGHFYEAIRRLKYKRPNDCIVILVAPILWIPTISEFKTKPLQRAVIDLQSHSLQPDILLCRVPNRDENALPPKILDKVASLTNVPRNSVIEAPDVGTVYEVPLEFYDQQVDDLIVDLFQLKRTGCRIKKYRELVTKTLDEEHIRIGIFGKYKNSSEAYISLKEALYHAGVANGKRICITWFDAEQLEDLHGMRSVNKWFSGIHGIIVPGGFDFRGVEGKMKAIRYAREKGVPFLGICLGLQCAVIEFARNVCKIDADSIEFNADTAHPVIHYVEGQEGLSKKAGTMRLGAYECVLTKESISHKLYGQTKISERHRHRYEVNEKYVENLRENGFHVVGRNPETNLVEMMEILDHPYFICTQAHPEFKSRLVKPAPLFDGLIQAAVVADTKPLHGR